MHLGGYSSVPRHTIDILDGIRAKLGNRVNIVTAEGVRITESSEWNADDGEAVADIRLAERGAQSRKRSTSPRRQIPSS